MKENQQTLRIIARKAKKRLKEGFWKECEQNLSMQMELAKENGLNESKASRYFLDKAKEEMEEKKADDFYERVKEMLLQNGEVSDAIGRLTDKEYYETLSYEEKQRYTLSLSEKYLRALERFRKEREFDWVK
jgi:hypothetical protein